VSRHVARALALTLTMACSSRKPAATDTVAVDTAAAKAPAPTTTTPDTTLPVMLPPVAGSVMKAGAPIARPLPPSQPVRPAGHPATTTDTVRGAARPVPAPNDVRPSIPNNAPKLGLPADSTKRTVPPR